jgi:hypothetical protein
VRLRALAIIANICAANSYIPATEDRHIDAVLHGGGYQVIIPHHETFSTTIQPPYRSTKG